MTDQNKDDAAPKKTLSEATSSTGLKIIVDRNLCIGAAPCVAIAGSVFQLDDEGKAIIINADGANEETIRLAAEACPVRAIKLISKTK